MPKTDPPIQSLMPPLICGTAIFNTQYNKDPHALPAADIVAQALSRGVRAFDTSPYYGPSEFILGAALKAPFVTANFARRDYFLVTKAGRIGPSSFDYSPSWIRRSVARSLRRLNTDYLDLVYCHDVEFVSDEEVLAAVRELRRIRDATGAVKYVGISGYPVDTLCRLAELVLARTGEPLDAAMSYAHFTLQNSSLLTRGLERLRGAGVGVVPNASILGMGLLRTNGLPVGSAGEWHPAPTELRAAAKQAAAYCAAQGDRIEKVAIRYSLEGWLHAGSSVGTLGDPASGIPSSLSTESIEEVGGRRLGASVFGCSSIEELDETMKVWRSILDTLDGGKNKGREPDEREWGRERMAIVRERAQGVRGVFGPWADWSWESPGKDFVNQPNADPERDNNEADRIFGVDGAAAGEDGADDEDTLLADEERFSSIKDVPVLGPIEFVDADKIQFIRTEQISTPGSSPERSPVQKATVLPEFE